MKSANCPKFESCSAPICPLEPDWPKRSHLDGERVCFYLTEYSKPAARPILRGALAREQYEAIVQAYPNIIASLGPVRRRLHRSSKYPPRVGRVPGRAA